MVHSRLRVRQLCVAVAAVTLTGCGPVSQQPQPSPTSAPTSAVQSPAAPATQSPSGSTAATGQPGKPSVKTLQAALVVYFEDQQNLTAVKAQRAAACAVYPSFQELSKQSLAALVRHDPAGMAAPDKKVFGDVTTECVTAAG